MGSEAASSPSKSQRGSDVWGELFATVSQIAEAVDLSLQALAPDSVQPGDKVISATTKKRLLVKSLQGLRTSQSNVQVLQEHLKALQAASQQWQRTMLLASKSHEELMEQLESTNRDLQLTTERLRSVEAQHLTAVRETEAQRQHILSIEAEHRATQAALKQRSDELETARFALEEQNAHLQQQRRDAEAAKAAMLAAVEERDRAVGALDGARAEADKSTAAAQRHQEAVARLTADNLVFLMSLKRAEADLTAATQEKAALRLAVERQRGPWFDEVRAGVEEKVRQAMIKAESLEAELETTRRQHAQQLQELAAQMADLEEYLAQLRAREASLEGELAGAVAARDAAQADAAAAQSTAAAAQGYAEELSMRNNVLQDGQKAMRQECTERWVSEQGALGKVAGLEATIASLQAALSEHGSRITSLQAQLETQVGVNRQLMARKEEVEWQLMAALSSHGGSGAAPARQPAAQPPASGSPGPRPQPAPQPSPASALAAQQPTFPEDVPQRLAREFYQVRVPSPGPHNSVTTTGATPAPAARTPAPTPRAPTPQPALAPQPAAQLLGSPVRPTSRPSSPAPVHPVLGPDSGGSSPRRGVQPRPPPPAALTSPARQAQLATAPMQLSSPSGTRVPPAIAAQPAPAPPAAATSPAEPVTSTPHYVVSKDGAIMPLKGRRASQPGLLAPQPVKTSSVLLDDAFTITVRAQPTAIATKVTAASTAAEGQQQTAGVVGESLRIAESVPATGTASSESPFSNVSAQNAGWSSPKAAAMAASLRSAPVFHPAMHPALMVSPEQDQGLLSPQQPAPMATPGRRISAVSVTTTPKPKQ